jgi:hypothetical protein
MVKNVLLGFRGNGKYDLMFPAKITGCTDKFIIVYNIPSSKIIFIIPESNFLIDNLLSI